MNAIAMQGLEGVEPVGGPWLERDYAFGVNPGRPELVPLIDAGLARMEASGELQALRKRWLEPKAERRDASWSSWWLLPVVPVLLAECRRHALPIAATFGAVALLALLVGLFLLPRNYVASTTILARESDIIQPLLEGRAVATGVTDRAGMARQVIFSRKVLEDILATGGWSASRRTPGSPARARTWCISSTATPTPSAPSG